MLKRYCAFFYGITTCKRYRVVILVCHAPIIRLIPRFVRKGLTRYEIMKVMKKVALIALIVLMAYVAANHVQIKSHNSLYFFFLFGIVSAYLNYTWSIKHKILWMIFGFFTGAYGVILRIIWLISTRGLKESRKLI